MYLKSVIKQKDYKIVKFFHFLWIMQFYCNPLNKALEESGYRFFMILNRHTRRKTNYITSSIQIFL